MLVSGSAIRLCEKESFIPNMEIKFIKNETDEYSFQNRIALIIDDRTLFISPLEIQIAYKIWLGSEKEYQDILSNTYHVITVQYGISEINIAGNMPNILRSDLIQQ